ncbi:hypothetical protein BDR05DRAFT_1006031 [Suillus weaverae]|nr:hypothetical protein BDR05DRAFT_1006031 [Suillus weaverae]
MVDPIPSTEVEQFVLDMYLPVHSFLHESALVREVFRYLDFLPDILTWRATSTHTRSVGSGVLYTRFSRIVQPFVHHHVQALAHVMHVTHAVITSSCAMRMLTGKDTATNNINFVIAQGTLDVFQSFIQDKLFYRWATAKPHYAFQHALASLTVYCCDKIFITVSEARFGGVFGVIASSPTTADMTMMTPGSVATFYPIWTLRHVTVANHMLFGGDRGTHDIGCITHPAFEHHDNTYWLGPACGRLCPRLWRNVADSDRQSLVIEWDARFSLRSMLARSNTIWRLSDQCANIYCPYNPANNACTVLLPPDPMPSDLKSILAQEARIQSHYPHYAGTHLGILYATSATSPYLVPIPFLDGVTQFHHISQLKVSHWVDQLATDRFIVFTSKFHKTYNVHPSTCGVAPEYGYTFFRDAPDAYSPPNMLVRDLAFIEDAVDDVTGNVLVVKHPRGNKHEIIDMAADDIATVNTLIQGAVSRVDSEFWT